MDERHPVVVVAPMTPVVFLTVEIWRNEEQKAEAVFTALSALKTITSTSHSDGGFALGGMARTGTTNRGTILSKDIFDHQNRQSTGSENDLVDTTVATNDAVGAERCSF